MGYAEKRATYWRGRYKIALGKYGTVVDATGATIKFPTKRQAVQAADEVEAKLRQGTWRDPTLGRITFGEYASRWYSVQELAPSSMENYKDHLETHLLPDFENTALADITREAVAAWEREKRAASYAASSVKTWRSTLHVVLEDAVDEGFIVANPATKRRGRGKRAGRSRDRAPEKAVTDSLGLLLIAERMAILSGRDDEFVAGVQKGYTGMRWGELVGLEDEFVRPSAFRIEWQLYELNTGEFVRCPPKDDSYRTVDGPEFLMRLVTELISRKQPVPCSCHGNRYVYSGNGIAQGRRSGASLAEVADVAEVSKGTVFNVLNWPEKVTAAKRERVEAVMKELGFVRSGRAPTEAAHWRRSGFATWTFQPATTGWFPKKAPYDARPVPIHAEPWPGLPVRGRGSQKRASACWVPIQPGLTPHGLRHSHKTIMEELGTPKVLMDERMGHLDGSVSARYSHVTRGMRMQLCHDLTALWERSLDARARMCPRSPVAVLDRLLRERRESMDGG